MRRAVPLATYTYSNAACYTVSQHEVVSLLVGSDTLKQIWLLCKWRRRNPFNLHRCSCYFLNIRCPQFPFAIKSLLLLIVQHSWHGNCILSRPISTNYTRCLFFMATLYHLSYMHLFCSFEYLCPFICIHICIIFSRFMSRIIIHLLVCFLLCEW